METINVNQSTYVGQGPTRRQFTKQQTSLLTKSMLIAGIGFMIICGLSELFAWAFSFVQMYDNFGLVMGLTFGFLIVSIAISMMWVKILWKGKATALTILVYSLYIITMSLAFGAIFNFLWFNEGLEFKFTYLAAAFAITGGIFLIVALVAKIMSLKAMITYGKIVGVCSIIMMVLFFAFMIAILVVGLTGQGGQGFNLTADVITWIVLLFMAIATFFYIIVDVKSIMGLSQFNQYTNTDKQAPAIVWYCGFKLLSDLINVLLLVIIFLARLRGRVR